MLGSRSRITGGKSQENRANESYISKRELTDVLSDTTGDSYKRMKTFLQQIKFMVDNTEHALTELVRIQKMDSVSSLARGLAHDMRNLLIIIQANANKIRNCPGNSDEVAERCEFIQNTAKRMEALVEKVSLLHYSAKKNEISQIELTSGLKKCIEDLKATLPENIRLTYGELHPSLIVPINTDELFRIVTNLFTNAMEAMPRGGEIKVSVQFRKVDRIYCQHHGNAYPGEFAVLRIEDSGNGIPLHIQAKIFDPLFSTKSSNRTRGWGLSIVYSIVKSRNGWIDVSTKEGRGAAFELFFPVCPDG